MLTCHFLQDMLTTLPLSHIMHWASCPSSFCLTVGDSASFSKLALETPLAYKMDDLLTSYIALVLASQDSKKQPVVHRESKKI